MSSVSNNYPDGVSSETYTTFANTATKYSRQPKNLNETERKSYHREIQEEHNLTLSSGEASDETCVKLLHTERKLPKCVCNQFSKTRISSGDRHPIAYNILTCCKCAQIESSETNSKTAFEKLQNEDNTVENDLTERHMYESVKHSINQNSCNRTCTSCPVPTGSSGYLHPISQTHIKPEHKFIHLSSVFKCGHSACGHGDGNHYQHVTNDSSYACVDNCSKNLPPRPTQGKHITKFDKYKCFRHRFYILLLLNIIFLLLNVVGLPFVYVAKAIGSEQENKNCLECDMIKKLTSQEMKDFGIMKHGDNLCCLKSTGDLLALLIKGLTNQKGVERNYKLINKLLTRRRSAIHLSGLVRNSHIVWRNGGVIDGNLTYDEHGIHINAAGTYCLYTKIGFKKGPCHTRRRIGYTVKIKGNKGSPTILAAVHKLCFNGTNYEQDFVTQTVFQVTMGQKQEVFIDIDSSEYENILKHHPHTFSLFEI